MDVAAARERALELLDRLGLSAHENKRPAQLSGGQQQRVAVARALAHKPQVLLLDEPFGALDAKIREELRRTIRSVQRELGITTVLVTHDQEEAFALADRIGVMNLGRLLEVGRPHDLYARPATRFVATFLGAANLLLARQGPDAIRFGATPVEATARNPVPQGREHEVVTVMRPEEVEVARDRESLRASYIGRAIVDEILFTGALERLRLRFADPVESAGFIGTGNSDPRLEAVRSQHEKRAVPLEVGDPVVVGARRLHVLPTPLSSFVACAGTEADAQALVSHPLLAELATRMKTRVAVQLLDVNQAAPAAGVAAIAGGEDGAVRAARMLEAGANEVLLLPPSLPDGATEAVSKLPSQVCIYWQGESVRAATLAVGASVLRQLSAEALCLATAADSRRENLRGAALRRLLDARSEARAVHGLEMRTELVEGAGVAAVAEYIRGLQAPMLVLGVTDTADVTGELRALIEASRPWPVLLVYRGGDS
jgi:ABC-type sugar transport system ATPase subunit